MSYGNWNGNDPGVGDAVGDQGDPYDDSYSITVADVAIYYYKTVLSGTLADVVPTKGCEGSGARLVTSLT